MGMSSHILLTGVGITGEDDLLHGWEVLESVTQQSDYDQVYRNIPQNPTVFVVDIRLKQVKRLYSGVSAQLLQNTVVPFFFQTLHTTPLLVCTPHLHSNLQ